MISTQLVGDQHVTCLILNELPHEVWLDPTTIQAIRSTGSGEHRPLAQTTDTTGVAAPGIVGYIDQSALVVEDADTIICAEPDFFLRCRFNLVHAVGKKPVKSSEIQSGVTGFVGESPVVIEPISIRSV